VRLVDAEEVPLAVPALGRVGGRREQRVERGARRAQPLDALAVAARRLAHHLLARVARGEREREAVARHDDEVDGIELGGRDLLHRGRHQDAVARDGQPVERGVDPLIDRRAGHADERLGRRAALEHAQ